MKRHAYLIIAHHHFDMLRRLIAALDSEHADFYIHINKQAQGIDEAALLGAMKKSKGGIYRDYKIAWGGDTQIRCEMMLVKEALKGQYDYYHLLSGVDIPLKTGEEIVRYFEDKDCSFLEYKQQLTAEQAESRARYYHFLQNAMGRPRPGKDRKYDVLAQINYELLKLQKLLKVDRTKHAPFVYRRGGNWFSITRELAQYLTGNEQMVRRYFHHTLNGDELFLQCVASTAPFADRIVKDDNLRLIDWQRTEFGGCSPHTFTMADKDMLLASDRLFARKFDPNVDAQIIDFLYERLSCGADD